MQGSLRLYPLLLGGQTMPSSRKETEESTPAHTSLTARIHCAGPSHDLAEPLGVAVPTFDHRLTNGGEQLEVVLFARADWIRTEVRDDSSDQERKASYLPLQSLIAPIRPERAAVEVALDVQQYLVAIAVLADRQARPDLPPDAKRWAR